MCLIYTEICVCFTLKKMSMIYTRFVLKVGQMDQNGTNPGLFQTRYQYILSQPEPNIPDLSHLGPI